MIERRPPTHIMTVKIPVDMTDVTPDTQEEFDRMMRATMSLVLTVSVLADRGWLCDEPFVELVEVDAG